MVGKLDGHTQKNGSQPLPYTMHKISPEWIKDLNARPGTTKLLKRKKKKKKKSHKGEFRNSGLGNDFLNLIPNARINEGDHIEWEFLCSKGNQRNAKGPYETGEDIYKSHLWLAANIQKYIKDSYNSVSKNQTIRFKNGQSIRLNICQRRCTDDQQVYERKDAQRHSSSGKHHLTPVRKAIAEETGECAGEAMGKGALCTVGRDVNWWETAWRFLKKQRQNCHTICEFHYWVFI